MAKNIELGGRTGGAGGRVRLDRVEEGATDEASGLVVAEFHDSFVGVAPVLVRDNAARPWAEPPLPGLPPK